MRYHRRRTATLPTSAHRRNVGNPSSSPQGKATRKGSPRGGGSRTRENANVGREPAGSGLSRRARSPHPKGGPLPSGLPSRENLGPLTQGAKQIGHRRQRLRVRPPALRLTGTSSIGRR